MGYIMDLRRLLGHRPLLQCGASVIAEDSHGRILLQLRQDNGSWAYAGGSVELDETVEDAARREFFEETGLQAGQLELLGVFSGPRMHFVYPNGDEVSNIDLVYVCRDWQGQLHKDPAEVLKLDFFRPDALPRPLFQANLPALQVYLNQRGYSLPQ
ncbi:MAG: NUDIX hydrolase [Oscillospiraceae bacterium]|nr:NUDIX hydrolase [Oscillospiraceae bacterium]MDD4367332.1 NUDIX hydrolase [Oscillospiraceae bacterium]